MARPARRPGNLPVEATSFVGRRRELGEVRRRLGSARVVSLVGPGGVGKTRLAIRAASELGRGFRDGSWLVGLAEVRDPALVANTVGAALDLRDQAGTGPEQLLRAFLADRQLLLVLDNCEHLLPAVADLANNVVTHAAGVRVLATSREPLGIAAEHVVPVPPLTLPAAHATGGQSEAVTLFVERAEAASGTFMLGTENLPAVADLCRRLDGLPLAIELAAVRTRVLSVEQILDRLGDRFSLLTGGGRAALPRHQTLETAIDWSHDLLDDDERALFRRLCVFAGRFTLADAEAVCGATLGLISSLVDKSLVTKEDVRGIACYRLHETMREYARKKLDDARESNATEEKFVDHYVTTYQASGLTARFHLVEWLGELDLEIDNVRAILRRCLERKDSVRGIELVTSLSWFWINRATTEGVRWLDELVASGPGNTQTLAWTYFIRGFLAVLQGDGAAARPALVKARAAAEAAHQPIQLANSLVMASIAELFAADRDAAARLLREAEDVAAGIDDVVTKVSILQGRCLSGVFAGDADRVREAATEGERLSREVGDLYAQHMMLLNLGGAAMFAGDLEASRPLYERALRIAYDVDDRIGEYHLLAALAYHASVAGQARVAARLLGASETIRTGAGATMMAMLVPFVETAEEQATQSLGASRYRAEREAGRMMTRDAAVALALGEPEPVSAEAPRSDGALAKREDDVARLVAEGMSNKQIAARLFISERTVDSHVRSILNKLGFNTRAQIAGWVASQTAR
ncbi:MAG TPA: LuxR C-terminal-related transcriptional regulator [Candidatus Dormibacteraeota bacterium]|nr:LuxR C-terminal-related transcriptional regulator [Candidatus Dormibacteraeota bacterium]